MNYLEAVRNGVKTFEIHTAPFVHPETPAGFFLFCYATPLMFDIIGWKSRQRGTYVPPGTRFVRGSKPEDHRPVFVEIAEVRAAPDGKEILAAYHIS